MQMEEKVERHYENPDAVRNVIRSHNSMLVSMPQEIAMRAGLQRGVQVRVDQDPANPGLISLEVINPTERAVELKKYLGEKKVAADNKKAVADRKIETEKKAEAAKKLKERKARDKRARDKKKLDERTKEAEERKAAEEPAVEAAQPAK